MHNWILLGIFVFATSGCGVFAATSGRVIVTDDQKTVDIRFHDHDRALIEDYYRPKKPKGGKKTPPGLAKREQLPPGLARKDTLPPGLQGRSLPADLETRLSVLPAPYVRLVVGADLVLMNKNTRVVVDILYNVTD